MHTGHNLIPLELPAIITMNQGIADANYVAEIPLSLIESETHTFSLCISRSHAWLTVSNSFP